MSSNHLPKLPPSPRFILRAGITGHRPIPGRTFASEAIKASLDTVFCMAFSIACHTESPAYNTTQKPKMTLISALAAGADQMAADAVFGLQETEGKSEVGVQAILPFSIEDYAQTMGAEDAVNMRRLLPLCDTRMILADFKPVAFDSADRIGQFRTNRRYETVGKMIVHQADFLVAVWDGQPSGGVGGTADIVLYAAAQGVPIVCIDLTGRRSLIMPGDMLGDPFCTIQQRTRPFTETHFLNILRRTLLHDLKQSALHEELKDSPYGFVAFFQNIRQPYSLTNYLKEIVPESTNWIFYQRILHAMGKRKLARQKAKQRLVSGTRRGIKAPQGSAETRKRLEVLRVKFKKALSVEVNYVQRDIVGKDRVWKGFPFESHASEHVRLGTGWAAADSLATSLGHAYRSIYLLVMTLSTFAVVFGLFGIVFGEHHLLFTSLELAFVFVAVFLHFFGHRRSLHERWMQARELEERLRASWAPMLLGGGGRRKCRHAREHWADRLCDAYLAEVGIPDLFVDKEKLQLIADAALKGIAKEQQDYHAGNTKVQLAIHQKLEKYGKWTLFIAIIVSASLLYLVSHEEQAKHGIVLIAEALRHTGVHEEALRWSEDAAKRIEFVVLALAAACAMLPTLGATASAIKFQGDFERSSILSHETTSQLLRVSAELRMFLSGLKRAELEPEDMSPGAASHVEFLLDIFGELETFLLSDLEDWRSIYSTRGVPDPA